MPFSATDLLIIAIIAVILFWDSGRWWHHAQWMYRLQRRDPRRWQRYVAQEVYLRQQKEREFIRDAKRVLFRALLPAIVISVSLLVWFLVRS